MILFQAVSSIVPYLPSWLYVLFGQWCSTIIILLANFKYIYLLSKSHFNLHFRPSAAPPKLPPSSYTNPAYFIFEGISVGRRMDESLPTHRTDPQVIWSGKEALQLPKLSGRHGFDRRPCRRSDFTEIEIPAIPPQLGPASDFYTPAATSSYQLFPNKSPSLVAKRLSNASLQYQEQTPQPREKYQSKSIVKETRLPEKNLRNLHMNHSVVSREESRQEQLLPDGSESVRAAKMPSAFPHVPLSPLADCPASVPWLVEQHLPGRTGDNSLTALQIAKSLSEVDFFPAEQRADPAVHPPRPGYRNGPSLYADGRYCWEKEVRETPTVECVLSLIKMLKLVSWHSTPSCFCIPHYKAPPRLMKMQTLKQEATTHKWLHFF